MWRTSPSRYRPVITGSGPPTAAVGGSSDHGGGRDGGGRDVDVDKVPLLGTVLENEARHAVSQLAQEECGDARVWGVPGHAWSVDVVEAQRGDPTAGFPTPDRSEVLAVQLGRSVSVVWIEIGGLRDQHRVER